MIVVSLVVFLFILNVSALSRTQACYDVKREMEFRKQRFAMFRSNSNSLVIEKPMELQNVELPDSFDWREKTVLSVVRNQHLPEYCGSCWAFASTSTIADRYIIKKKNGTFSNIMLSTQVVIDCANAGTCHGGYDSGVYEFARTVGIPDETCSPYVARDKQCTGFLTCGTCTEFEDCFEVKDYVKYKVSDYTYVSGENKMKNEIMSRGPISCSIAATPKLVYNYTSGVHMECESFETNHLISVVGWGKEKDANGDDLPYWIIRNSWGTFWGESGFFKLPTGSYKHGACSLNIEDDCTFPII